MNCKHPVWISLGLVFLFCGCSETAPQQVTQGSGETTSSELIDSENVPNEAAEANESASLQGNSSPSTASNVVDQIDESQASSGTDRQPAQPGSKKTPVTPLDQLKRISQLRSAPLDRVVQPGTSQQDEKIIILTPEQVAVERERRAREIVALAQPIIVETHRDPEQIKVFNSAVDALSDARLQLAISGDLDQAELLKSDAETFFQHDPRSFAAIETASRVLQYTQTQAQQNATNDEKWIVAYAQQAKLFAARFPHEANRAAIHLMSAGRLCDRNGLLDLALSCLSVIEVEFAETPYAAQVAGMTRRLRLQGQQLEEFGGSTLEGQHLNIQELQGAPVLIVFWASNSEEFQKDISLIESAQQKLDGRFQVVGVNMDREDLSARRFVEFTSLDWRNIFFSDRNKRGTNNPVANYYGVTQIPSYWLVDSNGVVVTTRTNLNQLEQSVRSLLLTPPGSEVSLSEQGQK
ncbi:thiol-disulfide oxidoreductase [Thalassoglobus neptunius]|uniref:Thiol-disulfide oxidoreductase n=1 Tax=Thalassoglobus neptunius TaxID=1938619 RepID=A0A5C5X3R5_9PLAN|nr:TlpA disulfide reductase family protein [Thalassoglobus neptunius]TWT56863.1 thiol-disulfide oxidoreductase [Thalassoglobus neptunius]